MAFDILNDVEFWSKCAREKNAQARGYNRLALGFMKKGKKKLAEHFFELSENARNAAQEALEKWEDARLYQLGFYDMDAPLVNDAGQFMPRQA